MNRLHPSMLLAALAAPALLVAPRAAADPPATVVPAPTLTPTIQVGPAHAAYVQIKGVPGTSKDVAHRDWIQISAIQFPVTAPRDAQSGMATGRRQHASIVVTKQMDTASPLLARAAATGQVFPQVSIEMSTRDGTKSYSVVLTDVVISGVRRATTAADESPKESVSFEYGGLQVRYTPQSNAAAGASPSTLDVLKTEAF